MRIVFQDLKVGLKKDSLLKRLSTSAVQRFDETRSLRVVCEEICQQQREQHKSAATVTSSSVAAMQYISSTLSF